MNQTDHRLLLDSSAWVAYFLGANTEVREYAETESFILLTSVLSLHEVKKRLIRETNETAAKSAVAFMRENSILIDLNSEISEKSVQDSIKHKLHTIDSLIYRTAIETSSILVTGDSDFHGLENVKMLK